MRWYRTGNNSGYVLDSVIKSPIEKQKTFFEKLSENKMGFLKRIPVFFLIPAGNQSGDCLQIHFKEL